MKEHNTPIRLAQIVVNTYKPIVRPTIFPAFPNASISINDTAIDTKTKGTTIHFSARINNSPTRPIQRMTVSFCVESSGCQPIARAIPIPIPIAAPIRTNVMGYVSIR